MLSAAVRAVIPATSTVSASGPSASGHAANVFSVGAPRGGTLENPQFLYTI
jgi:hypothetical protein